MSVSLNWCPLVRALVDCGADVNVVSAEYYNGMMNKVPGPVKAEGKLLTVNGEPLSVLGVVYIPVRVAGTLLKPNVRFFVVENLPESLSVLLGLEFMKEHLHAIFWSSFTFSLTTSPSITRPLFGSTAIFPSIKQLHFHPGNEGVQRSQPASFGISGNTAVVSLARSVVVRPRSSCLVNGTAPEIRALSYDSESRNENVHLFEPLQPADSPDEFERLTSVPAVVSPTTDVFPILLHNRSGKFLRGRAGTVVGHIRLATMIPQPGSKLVIHSSRIGQISVNYGTGAPDSPDELRLGPGITIDLSNTIHLTANQRTKLKRMLTRNVAVFANDSRKTPTTTLAQHRIDTGSAPPISVPPYRVGPAQRAQIDLQAQEMLEDGVIRQSNSPYSSPVLLVKKSDGKDRFCVDFRRLNLITKKDVYPLPRIDDMLDALGKADYFSVLDLQSGFWQIPLHPDDMEKTAFSTARGHYEFVVMPFGLCNAPATFQRAMDQLLRDLREFCQAYMDDVITFTEGDFDRHLQHLDTVLQRLQTAPMVAKPSKFKVLQKELKFLGHIISRRCIKPDPAKTAAVHAFPTPTCVKDLQSFLGLVGYYRRFIRDMATTAAPLFQLFKKGVDWNWGPAQQSAMISLKEALTTPPVMQIPDFDRDFIMCTDASGTGIGAVLAQLDDENVEHPVYFASRTLNDAERNYSTTKRECLAVRWACGQFRPYLLGRPFKLFTDHLALKWLWKTKDSNSLLLRWVLELQEYDMTIIPRPGTANANADAMSRLPGLLEVREAKDHSLMAIVTRTKTNSLPPSQRSRLQGMDTELVLDDRAYDSDEAIRQSLDIDEKKSLDNAITDLDGSPGLADNFDDIVHQPRFGEEEEADVILTDLDVPDRTTGLPPPTVSEEFAPLNFPSAQRDDPDLLPIIIFLEDEKPSHASVTPQVRVDCKEFVMFDGVLYHKWDKMKVKPRLSTQQYRTVIPRSLQAELLRQYHDGVCGAHLGESKTYERIADKMYWPSMYRDIKEYVHSCPKCGARKTSFRHKQIPIGSIHRPTASFECLGMDVLGPLPTTRKKNKYILVVTDYYTRWPIAMAMKNQRANTIATLLVEQVFCQHGFPATLLSDRGSNFLSELMAAVLHVFHVKKLNTTAYHPQTNGLTERFNHTLCTMLTHYTNSSQTDWDEYLPYILLAYRTTPHHTLKQTPFYMLYGRNVRFPFDTLIPQAPRDDLELQEIAAGHVDNLIEKLKVADQVVRARLLDQDQRRAADNAAMKDLVQFSIGDLVWLHNPVVKKGLTRKLTSPWTGPWKVVDKFANLVNYKIHKMDKVGRLINNAKTRLVHVGRLKPYLGPSASEIRQSDT